MLLRMLRGACVLPLAVATTCAPHIAPAVPRSLQVIVDGRSVAVRITGTGRPVVVLESGGGGGSIDEWTAVQDSLTPFATVLSYSRAGTGASAPGPTPRPASELALELHSLLRAARLAPPYVLVGHSVAGFYIRVFADRYPKDVAGLVFDDSNTEEFIAWRAANSQNGNQTTDMLAAAADTSALVGARAEAAAWPQTFDEARAARLPPVPVTVLAGLGGRRMRLPEWVAGGRQAWRAAQKSFAARMNNARLIVSETADHYIHLTNPTIVRDAVRDMLKEICRNPGACAPSRPNEQ